MRRVLATVSFACLLASACTSSNVPEPEPGSEPASTSEPETSAVPDPTQPPEVTEPPKELQAFEPTRTYSGSMHLPAASVVIRDAAALADFVEGIPKKIVTKGPRKHEDSKDPLLAGPSFDWDEEMIIAGVCHSFYCQYTFKGWRMDGDVLVVEATGGESEESMMYAQRPINPGGGDAVGHYTAIVVPRNDAEVRFEESPSPPDPAAALPEGLEPADTP